ncbi:MAG: glucose-6-phosphate dehydrogenase [Verrucomicrobia bacterium]|jgi:glucose-6-phosphate 1-dehydrogenase|nr:glucose-6-phosphate dehydrogenase [Verrucomicrobiota bacterium]
MSEESKALSIVVIGASGDLARKKIFPALFALYSQGMLPAHVRIFGFSRSKMTDETFRKCITEHLTCRYVPGESCQEHMDGFLDRCFYMSGQYDSRDAFLDLYQVMQREEGALPANRVFYLAIPPSIFLDVAQALGGAGLVQCGISDPWSRVVIEKPFGRDRSSSDLLVQQMGDVFREAQTFRIDHYLGKEVIQNLMVLRFANLVFEPLWNRKYIKSVQISWKEDLSVEGRGGYFDGYGIIRDVMQNHLLQIMSIVAMEPCTKMDAGHICNEKVKVVRQIPALTLDDLVVGQYTAADWKGTYYNGYLEDEMVPNDSITPTFAAAALTIDNDRWRGVPFLIRAGKGLECRTTEIRIQFRHANKSMYAALGADHSPNELVIRVQPDESIMLTVANKVPGMGMKIERTQLDLRYQEAFEEIIPDAYESLMLDVIRGDKSLFIRKDELGAAWDIFTPVLKQLETEGIAPEPYAFGSHGPKAADALAQKYGVTWA